MAKCFLTGIEVALEDAYLLDRGAAKRAVRNLKQRLGALERLQAQLTPKDDVEVFDPRSKSTKTRSRTRLVCPTVASALAGCYPEVPLFVTWNEFVRRRPPVFPEFQKQADTENSAGQTAAAQDFLPLPCVATQGTVNGDASPQ